ncbi:MAG TPA: hypothetical protein PKA51_06215 [Kiritimatiellia bacterium]|nr:hypothetical protein [Kiritimatiellia bacterium]
MTITPEAFKHPPATCRPMPLWTWNGEITKPRINAMLDSFAAQGMGGVFIHPRPGLITEYLAEEWFDLWGYALQACRARGLECHLYDENGFPSGSAGGHTLEADPEAVIRGSEYDRGIIQWTHGPTDGWTAGRSRVALTRHETTQTFIRLTHDAYHRHFGDDAGSTWKYCFTDEPGLKCGDALYATPDFLAAFTREHGYDLMDRIDDFLSPDPAISWPVRFDYWWTANRLLVAHFARSLHAWCDKAGLQFTGHFDEHEWPSPFSIPNTMAAQRWMQMPGVDLLGFQFDANQPGANALYALTLREAVSVARQQNRPRILCECYGGGGYGYTLDDARAMSVYLLGHGVNFLVPHMSMQSLSGSRKYDWPQTFSDHSPWWPFYRDLADHDARASWLLAQSTRTTRVLVLHPTLTGWLNGVPSGLDGNIARECANTLRALRENHATFLQALTDAQINFDLGDEVLLAEQGVVHDGRLHLGDAIYDLVVVPSGMATMLDETCAVLERLLDEGGTIAAFGPPPTTIRGRPDSRPAQLTNRPGWRTFDEPADLRAIIRPPTRHATPGLLMQQRRLPDGSILWVVANPWAHDIDIDAQLTTPYELDCWNPADGNIHPITSRRNGEACTVQRTLRPRRMEFWIESNRSQAITPAAMPAAWRDIERGALTVDRLEPNVLALHSCRLRMRGMDLGVMETAEANATLWREHGFDQSPWEWTIQFRREHLEHSFQTGSGYAADFTFHIQPDLSEDARSQFRLAVERPWLFAIRINGAPCDFSDATPWFDEAMQIAPIGTLLKAGENIITFSVCPMHIHAELAPVYLIGDFSVDVRDPNRVMVQPAEPLRPGHWRELGLPFYPWAVRYTWPFILPGDTDHLRLRLPSAPGSAVRIAIDGEEAGSLTAAPWEWMGEDDWKAGEHRLTLDVFGNLDSLLGPFHNHDLPVPTSWQQGAEASDVTPGHHARRPSGITAATEHTFRFQFRER